MSFVFCKLMDNPSRLRFNIGTMSIPRIHYAILALGSILRLFWWCTKHFWGDTFALKAGIETHSFYALLTGPLGFDQTSPIGFTLLSKILSVISNGDNHILTIPCLAAGIATLVVLDMCLHVCRINKMRLPFLLLFAFHPSLCYYSGEFKPYGFDVLFSAICLLIVLCNVKGRLKKKLLAVVCCLAPLFSSASFFVIPATFFALFIQSVSLSDRPLYSQRIVESVYRILPIFVLWIIVGAFSFWHLNATMPRMMYGFWSHSFPPKTFFSLESTRWYWNCLARTFRGPVFFVFVPFFPSALQLLSVLFSTGIILTGSIKDKKFGVIIALHSMVVVFLTLLASFLHKWPIAPGHPVSARLLLHWIPSITCLISIGTERVNILSGVLGKGVIVLSFLSICVFHGKLLFPTMQNSWKSEQAVETMVNLYKTGDSIFVDGYNDYVVKATVNNWLIENKPQYNIISPGKVTKELLSASPANVFFLVRHPHSRSSDILDDILKETNELGFTYQISTYAPTVLIQCCRIEQ